MPLIVRSRAQYLTRPVDNMRSADYNATHLVKAVKGLPLHPNSYSRVPIDGRSVRITEANKDRAMDWFAEWAADHVNTLGRHRKIIVPVPSSKTTLSSPPDFRTAEIARRIAARCVNTMPFPSLRFKKEMPNSREEGGTRDPGELYAEMELLRNLPPGELILLDDVLTGGGHLQAASWMLEDAGGKVETAICCGRSLEAQIEDPFKVDEEQIDLSRSKEWPWD
jgi:hypothetical protein